MLTDPLSEEIAHNFDFFQRTLADHLCTHPGKFALLKSQQVIGFFDTPGEADRIGWSRYSDRTYSIQQVTPQPVELGLYANATD